MTFIAFATAAAPVRADEPIPQLSANWIGETGGIVNQVQGIGAKWGWHKVKGQPTMPVLLLKLNARIPRDWKIIRASGDHVQFIGSGFVPGSSEAIRQLSLGLTASLGVLDLAFSTPGGEKKMSLAITASHREPYIVNFKSCGEYARDFAIKLKPITRQGKHLFIALSCVEDQDSVELRFYRSSDSKWDFGGFDKTKPQPGFRYRVPKPARATAYAGELFKLATRDADGKLIEYSVWQEPHEMPSRWDLTAGLGWTYFQYREKFNDISVNQMGFTGKVSFLFRIIPKVLTSDITVFKTLTTFGVSGSSALSESGSGTTGIASSSYLGINGRLGYRLPIDLGATEWFFFAGWYNWSMSVAGDLYGVNPLEGPQLFLQFRRSERNHLPYYGYFKFATISDSGDFLQAANNELGIGGGLGLSSGAKPFFATVDLVRTAFAKGDNAMTLTTLSLGISKRF